MSTYWKSKRRKNHYITTVNAIYLDRTYNAAEYLQSRDRIHRIGMPSNVEPNYYLIQSVHPNNFKKS